MTSKERNNWLVVIGTLLALSIILLVWVVPPRLGVPKQSEAEKYLLQQKDSLTLEVSRLESEVSLYKERADKLQQDLFELNKNLINIQNKYDKEISSVVSYTNPELEQFFSDRYGK